VSVSLRSGDAAPRDTTTDGEGRYRFENLPAGETQISFALINFAPARRLVSVGPSGSVTVDAVLRLSLSAEVVVTGKRTFSNLADAANPAEDLVGIAQSASQGAITAAQLEARPIMRAGEVLETVPGVIISQHSGEGKANQYYLRGFNLDHGTDFATTLAGMPVNMPTHGHGHGYSDLNFMIPELVSGVQYSKGPYFADQGDFATAGAANINYVNSLDGSIARIGAGDEGFARVLAAASVSAAMGQLLGAIEIGHSDGPWELPDNFKKVNGLVRYTRGDPSDGFSVTGMAYRGTWNSTDQIPQRAVTQGLIRRFGALDESDGGDSYRYSGSLEWQQTGGNASTRLTAYGIGYDLNLFSNFTFFLDDPDHGDQFQQADHRFVTGAKVGHRTMSAWNGRIVQNSIGAQFRHDNITRVGLYHTEARTLVDTVREDSVQQTSVGAYAQNEVEWTPWLRTLAGIRGDEFRFDVSAGDPVNSGTTWAGIASPKGGVTIGPFSGTEFYVNGGFGFHSNDARGSTITRDPKSGDPVDSVTPLARAKGAEAGVRTVAVPHLQSSLSLWSLSIDSELIFIGDAGTTEPGRPSHRHGIEFANYYSPLPWITLDADISWSHGHFTDDAPAGDAIPGSVETVVSAGITLDAWHGIVASARLRYFGPRPLLEDKSVRSKGTSLVSLEAGYSLTRRIRIGVDIFNLFDSADSDIDYYYRSRLPGEPAEGVADIHFHPTLPRTARLNLNLTF
jgi:outer membrane cobalamin receptor